MSDPAEKSVAVWNLSPADGGTSRPAIGQSRRHLGAVGRRHHGGIGHPRRRVGLRQSDKRQERQRRQPRIRRGVACRPARPRARQRTRSIVALVNTAITRAVFLHYQDRLTLCRAGGRIDRRTAQANRRHNLDLTRRGRSIDLTCICHDFLLPEDTHNLRYLWLTIS
jgi:hypothetical protein